MHPHKFLPNTIYEWKESVGREQEQKIYTKKEYERKEHIGMQRGYIKAKQDINAQTVNGSKDNLWCKDDLWKQRQLMNAKTVYEKKDSMWMQRQHESKDIIWMQRQHINEISWRQIQHMKEKTLYENVGDEWVPPRSTKLKLQHNRTSTVVTFNMKMTLQTTNPTNHPPNPNKLNGGLQET